MATEDFDRARKSDARTQRQFSRLGQIKDDTCPRTRSRPRRYARRFGAARFSEFQLARQSADDTFVVDREPDDSRAGAFGLSQRASVDERRFAFASDDAKITTRRFTIGRERTGVDELGVTYALQAAAQTNRQRTFILERTADKIKAGFRWVDQARRACLDNRRAGPSKFSRRSTDERPHNRDLSRAGQRTTSDRQILDARRFQSARHFKATRRDRNTPFSLNHPRVIRAFADIRRLTRADTGNITRTRNMTRRPIGSGPPTPFAGTRPSIRTQRFRRRSSWSQHKRHQRKTHGKTKARSSITQKTASRFSEHLGPLSNLLSSRPQHSHHQPPGWPCDRDLRTHRQRTLYSDNEAQVNSPDNPNLRTLRL
jgi:hypothetical protein